VERLTADLERGAQEYFDKIDRMGGMVAAIEAGFPQREIAESAYVFQQAVERKEKIIVGVNDFVQHDDPPIETLYVDQERPTRSSRSWSASERSATANAWHARSPRCARPPKAPTT
jgi:methylmalonyl-CoA mutase N-terminal domain/subunit